MEFTKRNIDGHEDIVRQFEQGEGVVHDLPEQYVIRDDSYFADYDTGHVEWSKLVDEVQDYIPVVGTLVRAEDIGRAEPDVFYKVLIKGSVTSGSAMSGIHDPDCKLLFVRTELKQTYTKVHKIQMKVDRGYYDRVKRITDNHRRPLLEYRLFLMNTVSEMDALFVHDRTIFRTNRIRQSEYFARKRREEAIKNATPNCQTAEQRKAVRDLELERNRLNLRDGKNTWHLDHVIPLQNKHVCGLHVAWNLDVIPSRDNLEKSNKFEVAS